MVHVCSTTTTTTTQHVYVRTDLLDCRTTEQDQFQILYYDKLHYTQFNQS